MKRTIFFWLEKLKISRAERYAITVLVILLVTLMGINAIVTPSAPFEQDRYRKIDEKFRRRSTLLKQKEQQILARYQVEDAPAEPAESAAADTFPNPPKKAAAKGSLIDINAADGKTLQRLPGIGPSYAGHILKYRRRNGGFKAKEELLRINGIGAKRLQKISPLITVGKSGTGLPAVAVDSLPQADVANDQRNVEQPKQRAAEFVLNVNEAGSSELQKLPGIGPAYAERIIKYRNENGVFREKDELLKIKGIGKKRLAKIKPFVKLTGQ